MRIQRSQDYHTSGKFLDAFFDWVKRIMQLAAVALVLLGAYLIYGLMSGGLENWTSLDAAAQARISANILGTIFYFNIALVVLLITSLILYYDEESLGYGLIILALALYFGVPFFVDSQMPGQMATWEQTRNIPMLALYREARTLAILLLVPAVGLIFYDIIRRVLAAGRGEKVDRTAIQYGGGMKELAPAPPALVGAFAKCWQLPFCRESLRVRCPIYYLQRRCWKERVGCMCEEHTIRASLAKYFDVPQPTGNLNFATGLDGSVVESSVPTGGPAEITRVPEIRREQVKIPYNTTLPIELKRERCRQCIIYNEHQRQKYQLWAPVVTLIFPVLTALNFERIVEYLKEILSTADRVMARLSFDPQVRELGIASATATSDVANLIVIVCLVVILTTMALRALEYLIFTLKI